jgi:hypothetical protein
MKDVNKIKMAEKGYYASCIGERCGNRWEEEEEEEEVSIRTGFLGHCRREETK